MVILPQINFNWFIIIIIISRLGSFPPMEFHTHSMYNTYICTCLYDRIPVHTELANFGETWDCLGVKNGIMHSVLFFSNGSYQTLNLLLVSPKEE